MLKPIFTELLKNYTLDPQLIDRYWKELNRLHTEKKRYYHNLNHLEDLYRQLLPLKGRIQQWEVILFTLFYHDAIYKSTRKDNEEKSAQLAEKRMEELDVSKNDIYKCVDQILATKTHPPSDDPDTNYFTDADLSILGRDWETYKDYCDAIRKEYSIYPNFMYRRGRKKVIKHLLSMDRIYKTEEFHNKYEEQARLNLARELKSI